jgi:hypothetical protein
MHGDAKCRTISGRSRHDMFVITGIAGQRSGIDNGGSNGKWGDSSDGRGRVSRKASHFGGQLRARKILLLNGIDRSRFDRRNLVLCYHPSLFRYCSGQAHHCLDCDAHFDEV